MNAPNSNKVAMSKALGAAFLTHQVEQLEKTVSERAQPRDRNHTRGPGGHRPIRKRVNANVPQITGLPTADIVVVDTSILVHALRNITTWCGWGKADIVIPLEALNTLDLLKKGNSSLAVAARAASRVLEDLVGTNPRIRVQRDDAFVPWDDIVIQPTPDLAPPDDGEDASTEDTTSKSSAINPPPEWLRRTICSARWEANNATPPPPPPDAKSGAHAPKAKRVVVAVIQPLPAPDPEQDMWRYEDRVDGVLVREWTVKTGLELFLVPTIEPSSYADRDPAVKTRDDRSPKWDSSFRGRNRDRGNPHPRGAYHNQGNYRSSAFKPGSPGGRDTSPTIGILPRQDTTTEPKPRKTPSSPGSQYRPGPNKQPRERDVHKPAEPIKVIRVLARGEKLDP